MNPEANKNTGDVTHEAVPEMPSAEQTAYGSGNFAEDHSGADQAQTSDSKNKVWMIIGYILPFLFFVPLVIDESKNDPSVRFHANQQAILLIVLAAVYVLQHAFYMVFYMGGLFMPIVTLLQLGVLVLVILGVINAAQGKQKELPLIGHFKIV